MNLSEIRRSYTNEKKISDFNNHFFLFYTYRPISFLLTNIFINLKISANVVSIFTFIFGPIIIYSTYFNDFKGPCIAFLSSFLFYVFDCIDGNMARISKKENKKGEFIDSLSGIIFSFFIYLFFSIKANSYDFLFQLLPLTSFNFLLISRYISLRFLSDTRKNFKYDLSLITLIKSIPDLTPILLILSFFEFEIYIISFLAAYNILGFFYVTYRIIVKN